MTSSPIFNPRTPRPVPKAIRSELNTRMLVGALLTIGGAAAATLIPSRFAQLGGGSAALLSLGYGLRGAYCLTDTYRSRASEAAFNALKGNASITNAYNDNAWGLLVDEDFRAWLALDAEKLRFTGFFAKHGIGGLRWLSEKARDRKRLEFVHTEGRDRTRLEFVYTKIKTRSFASVSSEDNELCTLFGITVSNWKELCEDAAAYAVEAGEVTYDDFRGSRKDRAWGLMPKTIKR